MGTAAAQRTTANAHLIAVNDHHGMFRQYLLQASDTRSMSRLCQFRANAGIIDEENGITIIVTLLAFRSLVCLAQPLSELLPQRRFKELDLFFIHYRYVRNRNTLGQGGAV
jgi:hypothetical protein